MYVVQQHLGINAGIVKMICKKINNCKTGISKKDGCPYKFEYIEKMIFLLTIRNQLINVQKEYQMKTKRCIIKKQ